MSEKIVGLVSASGAAGVGGDDNWSLVFSFIAYEDHLNNYFESKIRVIMEVSNEELKTYMDKIGEYSVIEIEGNILSDIEYPKIEMTEFIQSNVENNRLNEFLSEYVKPVIYKSSTFGDLVLDRRFGCFEVEATWCGESITLTLEFDDDSSIEEVEKLATKFWSEQKAWSSRVNDFAIEELLPLKNSTWLDESESSVSEEKFLQRMELTSISLHSDGSFEFWHDDGDLFFGHSIHISGTLEDGPQNADIPG